MLTPLVVRVNGLSGTCCILLFFGGGEFNESAEAKSPAYRFAN